MKTRLLGALLAAAVLATPAAAHHMSPMEPEIGDAMGMHEEAIDTLDDRRSDTEDMGTNNMENMDPADNDGTGPDSPLGWEEDYYGAGPLGRGQMD